MTHPPNKPTFFIAGQSKSGTTALYKFLQQHPAVFMCEPKEPNFFARDLLHDPRPSGSFHAHSSDWYHALYQNAAPHQRCGEASAVYLYSKAAAKEIADYYPEAQLICIFREPVEFLHAYYWQQRMNARTEGDDAPTFRAALDAESARRARKRAPQECIVPELNYYRERVRYSEQLQRVYEHFPKEQVLVLIYDDFVRDNAETFRQVCEFLGVEATFMPTFARHNPGKSLRSKSAQRWFRQLIVGEGWLHPVKSVVKTVLPGSVPRRMAQYVRKRIIFGPKRVVDPALAKELRTELRGEVEQFSALIGRDLVQEWGYEVPIAT